jgi:hypothetical protein
MDDARVPPRTRGECAGLPRPCTRTLCRFNLTSECAPGGGPRPPSGPLATNCALDAADTGPLGAEEIGLALGHTRMWVRVIEERALRKMKTRMSGSMVQLP